MIQAKDLTLYDVEERFSLRPAADTRFFREWAENLPSVTDLEKLYLDRVKYNFFSQTRRRKMLESLVKMVVISPLLDLAGFYQRPYEVLTEESVSISDEDEGELIQGRIDVLLVLDRLWVLVLEAKNSTFSLGAAIPQALAYMWVNPDFDRSSFGLVTNGSDFIFLKLTKSESQYGLSSQFSLFNQGNDLYTVLRVLKRLGELITPE